MIASTLAALPVLCDPMHAESGMLERNASVEAVLRHMHATDRWPTRSSASSPPPSQDTGEVIAALLLVAGTSWPYAEPGEALAAAYKRDATVAAMHRDFTTLVQRTLTLTIGGLLAGEDAGSAGAVGRAQTH
ncbi:hypothetical protein P3H15_45055 [Rhodococcus sp. T2V]|uniref:hypothetical protein n=1 Tax=Rhodococcus sp. T2V TaxID=3034164 RepID=UPI0023E2F3C1|nr:hypothetical protein [Rhodococcus sp. T2V]MDF3312145.1 hypothetical protein [Rhodococcus sp. T2V]